MDENWYNLDGYLLSQPGRKRIQATMEASLNTSLQKAIEECLMELINRDPRLMFAVMATILERVSAMTGSAQTIASVSDQSYA